MQEQKRISPETLAAEGTVAEVLSVMETDEPIWAAGARQRRQETRRLTLVALALVVWNEFENLLLR